MTRKRQIVTTLLSQYGELQNSLDDDKAFNCCYSAIDRGINAMVVQIKEFFLVEGHPLSSWVDI
jgi:hypothetical protein